MKIIYTKTYSELSNEAAKIVSSQINKKPDSVLGLATGTTVIGLYKKLVELYQKQKVDFRNIKTFNLDEYWPIKKTNIQSYHYFMKTLFFNRVNIKPKNINIPDGEQPKDKIKKYCKKYEKKIDQTSGIDLQILGIGGGFYNQERDFIGAHIGFNEPKSDFNSETRLVELSEQTRSDNSRFFRQLENVPHYAITMGLKTIMKSKKIVLLAYGDSKSGSIKEALEGPITNLVPASILQKHPNLTVIVDKGAGSKLNAFSNPWLVRQINWKKEQAKLESKNDNFIEKAVIWLSKKTKKTISNLKLEDYRNNNLTDLAELYLNKIGSINQEVIDRLNSKILTKTQLPFNKKILILSPHPDDDVISVGATIKYLQENGNSLKIIYMVSGNIAVRNEDVIKYLNKKQKSKNTDQQLDLKSENFDLEKIFELKSKVRENEAKRATITLGLSENSLIFLESPFYETGQIIKNEIQESDWQPLVKILENEKPDIIMVPGESTDPHGTHGKCIKIFRIAFKKSKIKNLEIWNYRGGWEEYSVSEADRIVTFSEKIMNKKIEAIKQHRSQLDPVFGGLDTRPFWKRAKDRNRYSGKILRSIGVSTTKYAELFKTEKQ